MEGVTGAVCSNGATARKMSATALPSHCSAKVPALWTCHPQTMNKGINRHQLPVTAANWHVHITPLIMTQKPHDYSFTKNTHNNSKESENNAQNFFANFLQKL